MSIKSLLDCVVSAAQRAPSADNAQPWKLTWNGAKLSIYYDEKRVKNLTFPLDYPATILTMGALLENIFQLVAHLNQSVQYQASQSISNSDTPFYEIEISNSTQKFSLDEEAIPLFQRHTNRFPYKSDKIPAEILNHLNQYANSSVKVVTYTESDSIFEISKLIKRASELRFRIPEVHEWLGSSLRFKNSPSQNDGLDVNTLNLPPGGNILLKIIRKWSRMKFLNYFGFYKILSAIEADSMRSTPAVVAVVSGSKFSDILASGQVMNRIWIYLNSQGIAVQPYYVISDQMHRTNSGLIPLELSGEAGLFAKDANQFFKLLPGESIQMLFRVGYPKKNPIRSKRLPINWNA
jgi:hypothetical protein